MISPTRTPTVGEQIQNIMHLPALPPHQFRLADCYHCPSAVIDSSEGVVDCSDDTCCPQK
jgi:hypothetical protein